MALRAQNVSGALEKQAPERRNTAKKKTWRTPHHRKKTQRNQVTSIRVFNAMIRTYILVVIWLYRVQDSLIYTWNNTFILQQSSMK